MGTNHDHRRQGRYSRSLSRLVDKNRESRCGSYRWLGRPAATMHWRESGCCCCGFSGIGGLGGGLTEEKRKYCLLKENNWIWTVLMLRSLRSWMEAFAYFPSRIFFAKLLVETPLRAPVWTHIIVQNCISFFIFCKLLILKHRYFCLFIEAANENDK